MRSWVLALIGCLAVAVAVDATNAQFGGGGSGPSTTQLEKGCYGGNSPDCDQADLGYADGKDAAKNDVARFGDRSSGRPFDLNAKIRANRIFDCRRFDSPNGDSDRALFWKKFSKDFAPDLKAKMGENFLCESEDKEDNPINLVFIAPARSDKAVVYISFGKAQFHEWINLEGRYEISADFSAAFTLNSVLMFDPKLTAYERDIMIAQSVEGGGYSLAKGGYSRLEVESFIDKMPNKLNSVFDEKFGPRVLRGYDLGIEAQKAEDRDKIEKRSKASQAGTKHNKPATIYANAVVWISSIFTKMSIFVPFLASVVSVVTALYGLYRWIRMRLRRKPIVTSESG